MTCKTPFGKEAQLFMVFPESGLVRDCFADSARDPARDVLRGDTGDPFLTMASRIALGANLYRCAKSKMLDSDCACGNNVSATDVTRDDSVVLGACCKPSCAGAPAGGDEVYLCLAENGLWCPSLYTTGDVIPSSESGTILHVVISIGSRPNGPTLYVCSYLYCSMYFDVSAKCLNTKLISRRPR